ncbi:MAG TPA: ThuA domain-containing protein [Pirellulales bacterium]
MRAAGRTLGLPLILVLLLAGSSQAAAPPANRRLLLLGQGPDGHPAGTHEYVAGLRILEKCLAQTPGLDVSLVLADEPWPEGPDLLRKCDGVVLFLSAGAKWIQADSRRLDALAALAARGGGLSAIHWAMGTKDAKDVPAFVQLFGGCHGGPDRRYKVLTTTLVPAAGPSPLCAGIEPIPVRDEFYYRLKFAPPPAKVLPVWQVRIDGQPETVGWSWERPDGGRSFGFSGLHFHANWQLPEYRRLVTQGVLWTMRVAIPPGGVPVEISAADLQLPPKR